MSYLILLVILSLGSDLGVFTDWQFISLAIAGLALLILDAIKGK